MVSDRTYYLAAIGDEVLDYLGWSEIDVELIQPIHEQIQYEEACATIEKWGQ